MTLDEVQTYLHEHIPLSGAMGVRVTALDEDEVVLEAPLPPNLNHRDTAFGGSVSALAVLAGWTLVHFRLRDEGISTHTVIQDGGVRYDRPVADAFNARCRAPSPQEWERFTRTLRRRGKARIRIRGTVESDGTERCSFEGAYVALVRPS